MFSSKFWTAIISIFVFSMFFASCSTPPSDLVIPTFTPSATVTATSTSRPPTATYTSSPTLRPSFTPPPTFTPVPSFTPIPTNTPTPPILGIGEFYGVLRDDFSNINSGWVSSDADEFGYGYANGGYTMYSNVGYSEVCSSRTRGHTDFIIDVDVTKHAGPNDAYFGVTCRKTGENYVTLAINGNGGYIISKTIGDERSEITSGFSSAINAGDGATNHLTAYCVGNIFTLDVNGQAVITVADVAPTFGSYVGLILGTYDELGISVSFDNFNSKPPEGAAPAPTFTPEGTLPEEGTPTITPTESS
jgi:hypothetical protein